MRFALQLVRVSEKWRNLVLSEHARHGLCGHCGERPSVTTVKVNGARVCLCSICDVMALSGKLRFL